MVKNNPKKRSLQISNGVEKVIASLERKGLIKSYNIRQARHTRRGNPRNPAVNYKGNGLGNQVELEMHCGSEGCYKVYVVPANASNLERYILEHYP